MFTILCHKRCPCFLGPKMLTVEGKRAEESNPLQRQTRDMLALSIAFIACPGRCKLGLFVYAFAGWAHAPFPLLATYFPSLSLFFLRSPRFQGTVCFFFFVLCPSGRIIEIKERERERENNTHTSIIKSDRKFEYNNIIVLPHDMTVGSHREAHTNTHTNTHTHRNSPFGAWGEKLVGEVSLHFHLHFCLFHQQITNAHTHIHSFTHVATKKTTNFPLVLIAWLGVPYPFLLLAACLHLMSITFCPLTHLFFVLLLLFSLPHCTATFPKLSPSPVSDHNRPFFAAPPGRKGATTSWRQRNERNYPNSLLMLSSVFPVTSQEKQMRG